MVITGAGSTVTVSQRLYGSRHLRRPGSVTISNGGVLNSQGWAEIDSALGTQLSRRR